MARVNPQPARLDLRIVVPDPPSSGARVEVRPLVDGVDILAGAFTEGPGEDPDRLLTLDSPLVACATPVPVRLAEAVCTEGCCGALYVTIRRDGDEVIWGGWHNPDEAGPLLPDFSFDAAQYQAEIVRAIGDRSWEWPAMTVARLLNAGLREHRDWPEYYGCELGAVVAWPWEDGRVNAFLYEPSRSAIRDGLPWRQWQLVLAVDDEDPVAQARRLTERLLKQDPRALAQVCGGGSGLA